MHIPLLSRRMEAGKRDQVGPSGRGYNPQQGRVGDAQAGCLAIYKGRGSVKVYRIQDEKGRGPWRPGFSIRWMDAEGPDLPPPSLHILAKVAAELEGGSMRVVAAKAYSTCANGLPLPSIKNFYGLGIVASQFLIANWPTIADKKLFLPEQEH